ncbi:photosystem II CP47 chlorophyll apoprotein, putative [Medicago truncatula]|uniref:Photosystem II CP47 chlorophyll apoprotein, putative n=1 Tax=Medicago truncatula TaxID=3880 RepID=G7LG42_MEDTR|nr:photosystem II CP47 chlorophyll apoprotein, putative [Medicago truncatula]
MKIYQNYKADVFAGIDPDLDAQVEFGAFQKHGDLTTKKNRLIEIGLFLFDSPFLL